jgi:hypothetical protein
MEDVMAKSDCFRSYVKCVNQNAYWDVAGDLDCAVDLLNCLGKKLVFKPRPGTAKATAARALAEKVRRSAKEAKSLDRAVSIAVRDASVIAAVDRFVNSFKDN